MTTEPQGEFIINDFETLKVVADSLRAQVFELLVQTPQTVAQVAEKLGLAPSKLYYHFGLLEKVGLIRVVETRQVRNMVEKDYRAVYDTIDVAPSLLNFHTAEGQDNIQALLSATLDTTRDDIMRSLQARIFDLERGTPDVSRRLMLTRETSRISLSRAEEFYDRLAALVKDFAEADDKTGDEAAHSYALSVALYPGYYYHEPKDEA